MCGFVGLFSFKNLSRPILEKMSASIVSRGPDDSGIYLSNDKSIAFAHRRLSILDLTHSGHQPMTSFSGRYIIVYNGEIYNHLKLRKDLNDKLLKLNKFWKGTSDTETLIAGFEIWGVLETIKKCEGMFSIAVWDNKINELILIRDRLGEKPLYFGWNNGAFYFGSDLKAFLMDPNFEPRIDVQSLDLYFKLNYIPTPRSIYKDIYKLQPGSILSISKINKIPKIYSYWSLEDNNANILHQKDTIDYLDQTGELEELLEQSVKKQMISDVPIGSFLSGGIDSSLITFFMQKNSLKKIDTFTVGFENKNFDESLYAKNISQFIGTNHHELIVKDSDFKDVIPKLASIYSEPFADSSQVLSYLISKEAKKNVSVILSGDGGDELFGGYNRHIYGAKLLKINQYVPISIRSFFSTMLEMIPYQYYDLCNNFIRNYYSSNYLVNNISDRIQKFSRALQATNASEMYQMMISNSNDTVINYDNFNLSVIDNFFNLNHNSVNDILINDLKLYLPDDIMCKVDRAAMANSLETRMPLVDHKVVEFAQKIPIQYKIRNGTGKLILRKIIEKHLPAKLFNRTKMGFEAPLANLLRTSLKDWAEDLISQKNLETIEYFNLNVIRKKWKEHLSCKKNWHSQLWGVLIYLSWLQNK